MENVVWWLLGSSLQNLRAARNWNYVLRVVRLMATVYSCNLVRVMCRLVRTKVKIIDQ